MRYTETLVTTNTKFRMSLLQPLVDLHTNRGAVLKTVGDRFQALRYGNRLEPEINPILHGWVAQEGGYAYEAPGETHTLVVDDDVEEMITLFQVNGAMIYVDPEGKTLGYDDVFTKIDLCRAHYAAVGLGADYVDQFIR